MSILINFSTLQRYLYNIFMKIPVLFNDFQWFVTIIKTQDNTLIKVQRDSYMTTFDLYMDHASIWDMKVTQSGSILY
jgi:hypothetical protein